MWGQSGLDTGYFEGKEGVSHCGDSGYVGSLETASADRYVAATTVRNVNFRNLKPGSETGMPDWVTGIADWDRRLG